MLEMNGKETVLYTFTGGTDGGGPQADLIRDKEGNLYGTTAYGGDPSCSPYGCGTVFKVDTSGHETVLYSFTATNGDGANPKAGLIRDAAGNLYGTTTDGGTAGCTGNGFTGCGTVFKLDINNKESILYSFTGTGGDGGNPHAGLILDAAGNLYGTTSYGGFPGAGTVFMLDPSGKETVLYSFTGRLDGGGPYGLVRDAAGNLYGTTIGGGNPKCGGGHGAGCGVVFKITP
jgi:uncharacterized repeat protein (TIGR03803 family)